MPRDQPQLAGWDKAALDAYRGDTRAHDKRSRSCGWPTSPSPGRRTGS